MHKHTYQRPYCVRSCCLQTIVCDLCARSNEHVWPVQGILGYLKEKDRLLFISANRLFQVVHSKIKTTPTNARTILSDLWTNHSNSFGKRFNSNLSLAVKYQQDIWDAVLKKDYTNTMFTNYYSRNSLFILSHLNYWGLIYMHKCKECTRVLKYYWNRICHLALQCPQTSFMRFECTVELWIVHLQILLATTKVRTHVFDIHWLLNLSINRVVFHVVDTKCTNCVPVGGVWPLIQDVNVSFSPCNWQRCLL